MGRLFLRPREVAEVLGVHPLTVYTWISEGKLAVVKTPGGRYLVPKEELEQKFGVKIDD